MLMRAEIPIDVPAGTLVNASWGSLMHGAVMELLPLSVSASLHEPGVKPWAQYVAQDAAGKVTWIVSALTDEMDQALKASLLDRLPMPWNLRQKGFQITVNQPAVNERLTYAELADKHFKQDEAPRRHKLRFCTPTTFKTAGKHVLFPTSDLILNSLMQRWDAFAEGLSLGDPEVREHLGTHVQIRDYRLASSSYSVDSAWIKGFVGQLDLSVTGPEALCRVASLLLEYGRFSGVGIKSALGMGGVRLG